MRSFKFRVYDTKEGYWLDQDHFDITGRGYLFSCQSDKLSIINRYRQLERPRFAIEWYTGEIIKGRNLYVGDICKATYTCLACFDCEPHKLTGEIEESDNGLWMVNFGHFAIPLDSEDLELLEIIGTIHDKGAE